MCCEGHTYQAALIAFTNVKTGWYMAVGRAGALRERKDLIGTEPLVFLMFLQHRFFKLKRCCAKGMPENFDKMVGHKNEEGTEIFLKKLVDDVGSFFYNNGIAGNRI